ncbi:MAG: glycosyltransferase, partial [Bacteroidia bacterium]
NQGIKKAKFDILAFLNNDVIVSPGWDKRLIEIAEKNSLEIITPCGIERLENVDETKRFKRKWNRIKHVISLMGVNNAAIKLMHKLMYNDWELFTENRFNKFGDAVSEGFIGNTIVMKKSAIDKLGLFDERIQTADFDLYVRSKKRSLEKGDIKPVHVAWGVFNHHFIRMTLKAKHPEFADKEKMITIEEKWGTDWDYYLKDYVVM